MEAMVWTPPHITASYCARLKAVLTITDKGEVQDEDKTNWSGFGKEREEVHKFP